MFVTVVAIFALAAPALAQQDSPKLEIKPIARMKVKFTRTSVDDEEIATTNFELRRIRFGTTFVFDEWLTGEFEAELAMARLAMRNMYVNMAFSPQLELRAGQFKKPFSLMELTSETIWPIIERGVRIRGLSDALLRADSAAGGAQVLSTLRGLPIPGEEYELLATQNYLSYDLGAMVHGRAGRFDYAVGAFNGEGSDRTDTNDTKSYTARVGYQLATSLPVALGAALSHRETQDASGTAYEVDLEIGGFRRAGLNFMGEATIGTNLANDDDFVGVQGVLAWFSPVRHERIEGIEVAGRASYGDPSNGIDGDEGLLLTPGFNLYFNGRNRLMINWYVYQALGERLGGENALRIQAQFSL